MATNVTLEPAGTDAGAFELSAAGVLSFKVTPDYEDKRDQDQNNVYEVIMRATDIDSFSTDLAVTITVTRERAADPDGAHARQLRRE